MNEIIEKIVQTIDKENVDFIYLIGSYARGKETVYSDIDIKVQRSDNKSFFNTSFVDGIYVSIKHDSVKEKNKYLTDPLTYTYAYSGLQNVVKLYDPNNEFERFIEQFNSIDYKKDYDNKINAYVNKETMEWIEEVNKSMNGLYLKDSDKLLQGLHGLSYGMLIVLCVSEGIFITDQGINHTMEKHFKKNDIYKLIERTLGIKKHSLQTRTLKGLRLYLEILEIIKYRFTEKTAQDLIIVKKNIVKALHNY